MHVLFLLVCPRLACSPSRRSLAACPPAPPRRFRNLAAYTLLRIRPKTLASEGKRQSGPSLGTPRGRGDKNKLENVLKYSWDCTGFWAPGVLCLCPGPSTKWFGGFGGGWAALFPTYKSRQIGFKGCLALFLGRNLVTNRFVSGYHGPFRPFSGRKGLR